MSDLISDTPTPAPAGRTPLFEGAEWNFATLRQAYDAIHDVAVNDLGLDIYPNQIEIITAEQMLDAYSSVGMPLMYRHWSFGKRFVQDDAMYKRGLQSLAYEIVINSNPCISYNMEENTMTMQTLVMAHAAFGHNHFFKNNYLFQQWTDAEGILDYMKFAKDFISQCEERYGLEQVEMTLDSAHALMDHGVNRYARPRKPNYRREEQRMKERLEHAEQSVNVLWSTLPAKPEAKEIPLSEEEREEQRRLLGLPEENILYFLEKHSPFLHPWQRELIRIVRNIAQYFYPQKQTKVMNEGCATFVHYTIMNILYDRGQLTDGAMLEFIDMHARVVMQPEFDKPYYGGINPYALGFAMMQDIRRICEEPTPEDREWFPDIAGCGDWRGTLRDIWANFRDESFIQQYLSPHLIRKLRLFMVHDDAARADLMINAIHDERGYRRIRQALAQQHDLSYREPNIQVADADLRGTRQLLLKHFVHNGVPLEEREARSVLTHVSRLWGYAVRLQGVDQETGRILYEFAAPAP